MLFTAPKPHTNGVIDDRDVGYRDQRSRGLERDWLEVMREGVGDYDRREFVGALNRILGLVARHGAERRKKEEGLYPPRDNSDCLF